MTLTVGEVVRVPLPAQVYLEALEENLLLAAYKLLKIEEAGCYPPASLSIAQRNDILAFARSDLAPERYERLALYAAQLCEKLPYEPGAGLPPPVDDNVEQGSYANQVASQLLHDSSASLWGAARQVVAQLNFKAERRLSTGLPQTVVRLGAYGHHSFCGLTQATAMHRSVCALLNGLVRKLRPDHRWTSLVVSLNSLVPPHVDVQNARLPSLLVGLSHYKGGQLWIQQDQGQDFEECGEKLLPGVAYTTSMSCVLFPAATSMHGVRPWSEGDRVVLAAFTIGQHRFLSSTERGLLLELGFQVP